MAAALRALARVPLATFAVSSRPRFLAALDRQTLVVKGRLPPGAQHWGIARKVLNIFVRSSVYNRQLSRAYSLAHLEPWLELPLDSQVAQGLATCSGSSLPRWHSVKGLRPDVSAEYQAAAAALARKRGVFPIHLEACWWRERVRRCQCAV